MIQEKIISIIPKIKVWRTSTAEYWSIIRTNEAIYLVRADTILGASDAYMGGLWTIKNTIRHFLASRKIKKYAEKDINTILSKAQQYFRFSENHFGQMQHKKYIFGGRIKFPTGKKKSWIESGFVKLRLSPKKYKVFLRMLNYKTDRS